VTGLFLRKSDETRMVFQTPPYWVGLTFVLQGLTILISNYEFGFIPF